MRFSLLFEVEVSNSERTIWEVNMGRASRQPAADTSSASNIPMGSPGSFVCVRIVLNNTGMVFENLFKKWQHVCAVDFEMAGAGGGFDNNPKIRQ